MEDINDIFDDLSENNDRMLNMHELSYITNTIKECALKNFVLNDDLEKINDVMNKVSTVYNNNINKLNSHNMDVLISKSLELIPHTKDIHRENILNVYRQIKDGDLDNVDVGEKFSIAFTEFINEYAKSLNENDAIFVRKYADGLQNAVKNVCVNIN